MSKTNKNKLLVFCLALGLIFSSKSVSAQEVEHIDTDTTWTKTTPDLVFDKPVVIESGATLTIEEGTRITFQANPDQPFNAPGFQTVDGKLVANGTREENVVITSPDDGFSLVFNDNDQSSFLRYVTLENGGFIPTVDGGGDFVPKFPVFEINGGKIHIENSKFANSRFREMSIADVPVQDADGNDVYDENDNLVQNEAQAEVINSNFSNQTAVDSQLDCWAYDENTDEDYVDQGCLKRVYLKDDWFGDPAGPTTDEDENQGIVKGYRVVGQLYLDAWRITDEILDANQACTEDCFSNVLFLPGIKSSRLYKEGSLGTEDQLWPPNYFGDDLGDLALDENGESINDVYTRDVLEESPIGGNIYKTFLADLAGLKSDGTINDYESFAYDWRQDVEDIAQNGTPYENITKSVIVDLQALAENSKSKKVTIVAHSNGGLVAKAAMLELEKLGLADKVDKIIFVGTPQMGTPLAILSLLYGYDEGSSPMQLLISRQDARALSENMPGAYGLLPSEKYFQRMEKPFINFLSEQAGYEIFKDAYGENIDSFSEFKKFLLGSDDKRAKPEKNDVESENILNKDILDQAEEIHQRLDSWTPPDSVEAIQIAGWGLDTVSGVDYTKKETMECYLVEGKIPSCAPSGEYEPVYDPKFTVDGDRVVVAPSALMLPADGRVKRYWVDLWSQNKGLEIDREHKSLLEVDSVKYLLDKIITKADLGVSLPPYIGTSRPEDYADASSRLRMSLYSPLNIHLYDDAGRHTGPKTIDENGQEQTIFEENIPNSYYYQFGDRKYVGFPKGRHIRVEMDGYALGAYTLKLAEVQATEAGEEIVTQAEFSNLPTTADTIVKMDIPEAGIADALPLRADMDSDGADDYVIASVPNGAATLDTAAPTTEISIDGPAGDDGWYMGDAAVSLKAKDNEGGSGVGKISYSLDNGANWNDYTEPVNISNEGITTFQYYAIDKQGNKEETKTETIKIDKTAPEAGLRFDPVAQKLDISGMDNLSQNVSVSVAEEGNYSDNSAKQKLKDMIFAWLWKNKEKDHKKENIATAVLTDEAGHTTTIVLEKKRDVNRRIDVSISSLAYDGVVHNLSGTSLGYKWKYDSRKKKYMILAASAKTPDGWIESHYRPKKDITILMQRPQELDDRDEDDEVDARLVRQKLSGLVIPALITAGGSVKINY
ncbi:MAG: hypothetical protein Q8L10_02060 [Candidatus Moranbacteria bacterium]|nr:hypothetical protein [Candidatus Moranbacteria bacterium]